MVNARIVFLLSLIGMLFLSCERRISGPLIDSGFSISLVNAKGDDLLDPSNPNFFNEENLEMYVLKKDEKVRLYQGNLDAPKFFKIRQENNKNRLQIYFDVLPENFSRDMITQYLVFKDGFEIEMIGEFNADRKKNKILQKLWVNKQPKDKTAISNSVQIPFVIVK